MAKVLSFEMLQQMRRQKENVVKNEDWEKKDREVFAARKDELIQKAIMASEGFAFSYRNLKVGCAILYRDASGNYFIEFSGNVKLFKAKEEGSAKKCAERIVTEFLTTAETDESPVAKKIVGVVTASRAGTLANVGEVDQNPKATVRPCDDCKVMFSEKLQQGFVDEDTPVITTKYDWDENDKKSKDVVTEEHTMGNILDEDVETEERFVGLGEV